MLPLHHKKLFPLYLIAPTSVQLAPLDTDIGDDVSNFTVPAWTVPDVQILHKALKLPLHKIFPFTSKSARGSLVFIPTHQREGPP